MEKENLDAAINSIINKLEEMVPAFKSSPEDWNSSQGNVAVCFISEEGMVYGKIFGSDKIKGRNYYSVAWKKASQVWITGHNTGDYEKIVFGGQMDPEDSPIKLPDLIGWIGGQRIKVKGHTLAVGFSGFKGHNDLKIVRDALNSLGLED